jgi:hypothetical protein
MRRSIGFLRRTKGVPHNYTSRLQSTVDQCKAAAQADNAHNSRCISHTQPGHLLVSSFVLTAVPKVSDTLMTSWQHTVRSSFPELAVPVKISQRNHDTWDFQFPTPSGSPVAEFGECAKIVALCVLLLILNAASWCYNYGDWVNTHHAGVCP